MKSFKAWMQKGKKMSQKGFTLVELIIVIVIIAVLAAIAIPAVAKYIQQANSAKVLANAKNAYTAVCTVAASKLSQGDTNEYNETTAAVSPAAKAIDDVKAFSQVPSGAVITFTFKAGEVTNGAFTYKESGYTAKFSGSDLVVNKD